jgi:uncharacterized damage-inducible protein DinB
MTYDFLIETYATERLKVVSVWSEFRDEDLPVRPRDGDPRGRSVHEHMVHQCVSEDLWFRNMLGIDVQAPPLPQPETRMEFIRRYAQDSGKRLEVLKGKDEAWWETPAKFFDVQRSRAWIMTRRLTHTAHHRGQQMAMLRMLGRDIHSNYGPTADTGGLMQNHAPTIYAYTNLEALLQEGPKAKLSGPGEKPPTELLVVKARESSVVCSISCAFAEPVAGLALADRFTDNTDRSPAIRRRRGNI